MTDRRKFLTRLAAGLAGLGVGGAIRITPNAEESNLVEWEGRTRVGFNGEDIPISRMIPSTLEGFEEMGISKEEIVMLANSALLIRAQTMARVAIRNERSIEEIQETFRNYRPTFHPRPRRTTESTLLRRPDE